MIYRVPYELASDRDVIGFDFDRPRECFRNQPDMRAMMGESRRMATLKVGGRKDDISGFNADIVAE